MPPQFGYKQHELMSDIALAVGAKYFSEKTGDDLSLISMEDLGHAAKVIVGRDNTIIIRNNNEVAEIPQRVEELWEQHKHTKIKSEKDFILQRIASLSGGIGVIYVGGNSDVEQKEKFDRVDDAVCAVRSALEEGIIAGGGVPLLRLSKELNEQVSDEEERVALLILKDALAVPCKQILINAGEDQDKVIDQMLLNQYGYDVKNQVYGDMYKMGVIDPLKVTKNALINAVSVATTILSTNAIVTLARTYDNK
jgi:chaperonin GroEL